MFIRLCVENGDSDMIKAHMKTKTILYHGNKRILVSISQNG